MNKELEKINQDIEKAQSRLRRAQHEKKDSGTSGKDIKPKRKNTPVMHQRGNAGTLYPQSRYHYK